MNEKKRYGFLRFLIKHTKERRIGMLVISAALLGLVYLLVYITDGTQHAYLHAMYIPIVIIAAMFGFKGGIVVGIVAGIVLGPLMPLSVSAGIPQAPMNWAFRTVTFIGVGALVGGVLERVHLQYRRIDQLFTTAQDTGLPNYQAYLAKYDENELDEAEVSMSVIINNYEDIIILVGRTMYASLMKAIFHRIKSAFNADNIYQVDARKIWLETDNDTFKNDFQGLLESFDLSIFTIENVPLYVDISFGVYLQDNNGFTRADAFRASEIAAVHAKHHKLKYSIYQEDLAYPQRNLEKLGALPLAIEKGELFLEYHPIVDLKNNEVVALEALVRWRKDGEVIPPLDFIPLAEETRLIDPMTDWIVSKVIEEYPSISGGRDLSVHINVSQRNLYNPRLIESMITKIKQANYKDRAIVIEMTESTVMLNLNLSRALLETLKKEGIPMSIDDFGVGYSTFSCLYELPVERLKIDKEFVLNMFGNAGAEHLIGVIIDFAHRLGIEVIAEGIETEKQAAALKARGCDYGQGFMYAKPMPAERIIAWLDERDKSL